MRLLTIFLVAILFSVCANFYAYKRFISKVDFLQPYLKFIRIAFFIIVPFEIIFFLQIRFDILNLQGYLIAGTMVAFSWFLLFISLIYDITKSILKKSKYNSNRRKFIKFCFDVTFVVLFASYFLKGVFCALTPPKVKHTNIKIKGLASGLRIALISDVHIGEFLQKEFMATLVFQINEQRPDMVVIVGDLIDFDAQKIGDSLDPLKDLRSTYGTFYVPGNHEYYHGVRDIMVKISELGIKILGNESISVGGINLAGVYDLAGFRFKHFEPDLEQALAGKDESLPTVLLSHQPKFIKTMQKDVDLVLCGHTHAGQIFPFQLLVMIDQPYLYGLYKHNDKMQVYVSSGAGFWGPPVRILAPSEIAILNLYGE
ncbi:MULTISPECIES: metallophosphoesterase [unclassified Campylobacter]|uniref:metallophosphoesterase n=1 Tax=unclassified Campylobacter TaxID=2593542 RepID=UPI003D32C953